MTPRTQTIHFAGAHRGVREVRSAMARNGLVRSVERVTVTDPKEGRAATEAEWFRTRGIEATAYEDRCEDVFPTLPEEGTGVLAVDHPAPMAEVLRRQPERDLLAQGVARGPGSRDEPAPAFAVNLAAFPERTEARQVAMELLDSLGRLSPPQSSLAIREDPLGAMALRQVRSQTAAATVESRGDRDRARDRNDLLNLTWAKQRYPLLVLHRQSTSVARFRQEALDRAASRGKVAVALLGPEPRVDFYVLGARRDGSGGYVRLWVPFQRLFPALQTSTEPQFRDDFGESLGNLAFLAAAAFTD